MASGFLLLASKGGSSEPAVFLFGPLMMLLIIVLLVFAVAVAVLTRYARRRLFDEPGSHQRADLVDPWAEAGRRLGGAVKSSGPPASPEADGPDEDEPK